MNTLEVPKRIILTDKTNYILSVTNSSHKIIPVTSITIKYPIIYYIANNIVMASDSNRIVFMNIINGEIINSIPIALDRNLPYVIHN